MLCLSLNLQLRWRGGNDGDKGHIPRGRGSRHLRSVRAARPTDTRQGNRLRDVASRDGIGSTPAAPPRNEQMRGRCNQRPRLRLAHSIDQIGLVELVQERQPGTNAQRIAVFALYRERAEGRPRFSRHDLEGYFAEARIPPPANYDRDFNKAVEQGWIHEDGEQSYLTTKGIEAVEAGFGGRRASPKSTSTKSTRKKPQTAGTKSKKKASSKAARPKRATGRRRTTATSRSKK